MNNRLAKWMILVLVGVSSVVRADLNIQSLTVLKDLTPIASPTADWSSYTYYFRAGTLVDYTIGFNTHLGCTVELREKASLLRKDDLIRIRSVEQHTIVEEECQEYATTVGGDSFCKTYSGQYYPKSILSFQVEEGKVASMHCQKISSSPRRINEPMNNADFIDLEDLKRVFGNSMTLSPTR